MRDFLGSLNPKQESKVLRAIQLVQEFGPELGMPAVETIQNGLQCLRVKYASDIFRVFFILGPDHTMVFLNGFRKKTPKTPRREIKLAVRYQSDYLGR